MGFSGSFEKLSQLLSRYESDGGKIQHVEVMTADQQSGTGLSVTLDLPVSLCLEGESRPEESPQAATISDDGGLQVTFSPSILPELDEYVPEDASVDSEDVRVTDDGIVLTTLVLTFGTGSENQSFTASTSAGLDSQTCSTSVTANQAQRVSSNTENSDTSDTTQESERTVEDTNDVSNSKITPAASENSGSNQKHLDELGIVRNKDIPPYEDTEYLQSLYNSFDTFTAMSEKFEMDVASETLRRYMIDAGVHEPTSYQTSDGPERDNHVANGISATEDTGDQGDGTDEQRSTGESAEVAQSPSREVESEREQVVERKDPIESVSNKQLIADGIGLPDNLTIEELADTIESSMTLYDTQRRLDLPREQTRELLEQLNLLDIVMRRMSHNPDQQVSREKIADRIRNSAISDS